MRLALLASTFALVPGSLLSLEISPRNGRLTAEVTEPLGSLSLPDRPWEAEKSPRMITGAVQRRAWRLPDRGGPPELSIAPLVEELRERGWTLVFTCSDRDCGGFDFRFQLSLLPAPQMHVDLGDYAYALLRRDGDTDGIEEVALVASRAGGDATLHLTHVQPPAPGETSDEPETTDDARAEAPAGVEDMPFLLQSENTMPASLEDVPSTDLVETLRRTGRAVLSDVAFASGSARLSDPRSADLQTIASWLEATPTARVVFVGHTDAVGSLSANTALSQRRARAVANAVAGLARVAPGQIEAAGAGYLAPVASNLSDEGQAANRRVEVVLLAE